MSDIVAVTEKELKRLFKSREFAEKLTQIVEITDQTNCEAGFDVYRLINEKKPIISSVPENDNGANDPNSTYIRSIDSSLMETGHSFGKICQLNNVYELLIVHTHPIDSLLRPSESDLKSLTGLRFKTYNHTLGYMVYPIEAIAKRTSATAIGLLLIQNKAKNIHRGVPYIEPEFDDEPKIAAHDYDAISDVNATLLTFNKRGRIYRIADTEDIGKFAFTPTQAPHYGDTNFIHKGAR